MAESKTKATTETKKKAGRPRKKVEAQPDEIITQQETSTVQAKTTPEIGLSYIVTTVNPDRPLNVRSGAGKEFRVVRQIPNATPVKVHELCNGWGRIGPNEWVMMSLLNSL